MSEEKQIEEMARTLLLKHHGIECFRNCIPCRKCTTYNYAETIYNAGYRKQEWISVEERLPDKEGTYLTYTDKDRMLFDSFCIYPSIGTKFWIGGNGKVTHWMPLPEAPKMKGGEE